MIAKSNEIQPFLPSALEPKSNTYERTFTTSALSPQTAMLRYNQLITYSIHKLAVTILVTAIHKLAVTILVTAIHHLAVAILVTAIHKLAVNKCW